MMPSPATGLPLSEPDIAVLDRLSVLRRGCLAMIVATVAVNLFESLVPSLHRVFTGNWRPLSPEAIAASVLCVVSFYFSHPRFGPRTNVASALLAALVVLGSALVLAASLFGGDSGIVASLSANAATRLHLPVTLSPESAGCFGMIALSILFLRVRGRAALWLADFLVFCLSVLVLVAASARLIAWLGIFGPPAHLQAAPQTLLCLLPLATVVFIRQAERGVFSILLGRGIGSRIARGLAPILLMLPYLREAARAHLIGTRRMPPEYITAFLATLAVGISILLLMYLAWRFNSMEAEIHDLSLRDELTGLYNLRGFRLLANQALLLARRSGEPFSLLFVDLDDLKNINDLLGHQAGSDFLVETAEILKEAFRETDVLARIGGDEFAVAGQFSRSAIAFAAKRLGESAAQRSAESGRAIPLSFSVGHATSEGSRHATLEGLLAEADDSMYRDKRRRKAESQLA